MLAHVDFWQQKHISKKLEQGRVCHYVASSLLLTTVCNHLGTEILEDIDKANTSKYKLQFLNDDFIYQEKRGIHTYLPPQWNNLCHSWQQ